MSDLARVYELWRERSTARWQELLGDDAGDLIQDVWLRLHPLEAAYEHQSDAQTLRYIEHVAAFALRDLWRVAQRRGDLFSMAIELGAAGLSRAAFDAVEARVALLDLADKARLPLGQRVALLGRVEGLQAVTVARLLGVSVATLAKYERLAVKALRESHGEGGASRD